MKKLTVNCATCDARSVTQQTLESFESIMINAATIITTPASKVLMAQYHVTMNCANALTLDEDAELITVNGKSEIKPSDAVTGKKYLVVNGKVSIAPGSEKVLEHYVGMLINGKVICPESLSGALGMMTVNGKTVVYPDGAVILEGSTVINKLFTLRAKNKLYWADKRLIMADPQLDPAALAAKGASFSAPEVIITESLVDGLLPLIDEKADIQVVPDGTTVVDDDVKLTNGTIRRYGDKIYVLNDFEAGKDSAEALERIEYLHICGDAEVDAQVEELFYQKAEIEGEVTVLSPTGAGAFRTCPM